MSRFKFSIIILLIISIIIVFCYLFCFKKTSQPNVFKKNIRHYSLLLKKEPNNCFYLNQIANGYQSLYNFDQAIKYYKETLKHCPNSPFSQFQLGVSYYLIMEKDLGLEWMNKAIETAKETGDDQLATMLQTAKVAWLGKWDSIKEMDWNKSRNKQKK